MDGAVESVVYHLHEQRYTQMGQRLPRDLTPIKGAQIKPGLVRRLADYARRRLNAHGFPVFRRTVVETNDENTGVYSVEFHNDQGGVLKVVGIMLNKGGWPHTDHGFDIEAR